MLAYMLSSPPLAAATAEVKTTAHAVGASAHRAAAAAAVSPTSATRFFGILRTQATDTSEEIEDVGKADDSTETAAEDCARKGRGGYGHIRGDLGVWRP